MSFSLFTRRSLQRAFTTSAVRRDFGWSKLVSPSTSPAFIARMKELDAKLTAMRTEIHSVPAQLEPIDWADFERKIVDKKLVAQLKKEYESTTFPKIEGEDLTKINADLDFAIGKATGAAAISKAELPAVQAELKAAIAEKTAVHNWTLEDFYARYPGLEEQCLEEFMNAEYLASDAEDRLEAQDINEARKQFRAGQDITLPDGLPDRVGNLSGKEEKRKALAMLDKMFGGAKTYEAYKAQLLAAEAKKEAKEEHHH